MPIFYRLHFNLTYTSGGDTDKTDFWILLFPSDHTEMTSEIYGDSAFQEVRDSALDCVKVVRSEQGNTVTPQREVPDVGEGAPAISALPAVSSSKISIDVGFYTEEGQQPGDSLGESQIRMHLNAVKKFSNAVRFYNAGGDIGKAYEIANELGLSVVGTAYLSGQEAEDLAELDALIDLCNRGLVEVACVGNETLLKTDTIEPKLTTKQLVGYINYVRDRLEDESIPVTTSDSVDVLMSNGAVRKACNLIMPNCYPFWGGADISEAAQGFIQSITALQAVCGDKQVIVSETGWPTAGGTIGNAAAGEDEAAQYFETIREWSLSTNTQIFYFASADEPWKTNEQSFGTHFGLMTNHFVLKDGYADTTFFKDLGLSGSLLPEEVNPVIAMTHVPACGERDPFEGCIYMEDDSEFAPDDYHLTLYLQGSDGQWWIKPSSTRRTVVPDEEGFFSIPYTSGGDTDKTNFRILLLPKDHESLPLSTRNIESLCESSLDCVNVKRTQEGDISYEPLRQVSIESAEITGVVDKIYSGSAQTQDPTVNVGGNTLKKGTLSEGTDYTLSYSNNVNAGTATVTVTGKGKYKGSISKTFAIRIGIEKASVSGVSRSYGYSGRAYTPVSGVKVNGVALIEGTDYTIKYENNENPGTATITITGIGNYTGTRIKTFEIVDCVSKLESGKTYQFIPKNNSSTAVCSFAGKMVNNTKVYITNRSASEAMRFKAVKNADGTWKFINAKCELALAVQKNSSEAGKGLVLYNQTTKKAQNWKLLRKSDNSFAIINSVSGLYVSMSDMSAPKGTLLSMKASSGRGDQRFYIVETSAVNAQYDGTYAVRASKDKAYGLNIDSASKTDGANVNLHTYSNTSSKKFKVMYSGAGYYRLVNVNSGLVLTVEGNTRKSGTNVIQSRWRALSGQRWKIIENSNGTVTFRNALGTVLHLTSNKTANGTNVVARKEATTGAQKWYLE